jgi:DNA gyrase subunit A
VRQKYADKRRTQIAAAGQAESPALTAADLAPQHDVWVTVLQSGLVSRTPKGKQPKLAAGDAPLATVAANTRDLLYFVTLKGRGASVPVYALPEKEDAGDGTPWSSVSSLDPNARVVAVVAVNPDVTRRATEAADAARAANGNGDAAPKQGAYLLVGTAGGMVKKTSLADLPGVTSQVFNAINVAEDDSVIGAQLTDGNDEILLVTSLGRAIRFNEDEVRPMGLAAAGVMGIKPGERDDRVIGLAVARPKAEVLLLTDQGMGKRTPVKEFPTQGRHGVGVVAGSLAGKQRLAGMVVGEPDDRLTAITSKGGGKPLKFDTASRRGRAARGSALLKLKDGETVQRVVLMQGQFSLPPEPEPVAAKTTSNGRHAPEPKGKAVPKKAAAAKKASAAQKTKSPKARPAAKTAKKTARRK